MGEKGEGKVNAADRESRRGGGEGGKKKNWVNFMRQKDCGRRGGGIGRNRFEYNFLFSFSPPIPLSFSSFSCPTPTFLLFVGGNSEVFSLLGPAIVCGVGGEN